MRKGFVLLALAILAGETAGQGGDKERLRHAARMPILYVFSNVHFNLADGLVLTDEKRDVRSEIAPLRKALTADPSDPDHRARLGELSAKVNDDKTANLAFATAAKIYRHQLLASPDDSRLLTRLAGCLGHDKSEKESLLRRAVKVNPGNWEAWVALADWLQS